MPINGTGLVMHRAITLHRPAHMGTHPRQHTGIIDCKKDAILINTSRGPVVDETALVDHCRRHPDFRAGLDVFEREPTMAAGLDRLDNVVIVPHIASATRWTREGMAILAACNVAGLLRGDPLWQQPAVLPFLENDPPQAIPSIVNARELDMLV